MVVGWGWSGGGEKGGVVEKGKRGVGKGKRGEWVRAKGEKTRAKGESG